MKNLKQIITIIALAVFMLGSFNGKAQNSYTFPRYEFNGKMLTGGEIHNLILEDLLRNSKPKSFDDIVSYLNKVYSDTLIKNAKVYKDPMLFLQSSNKISSDLKNSFFEILNQISALKDYKSRKNKIINISKDINKFDLTPKDKIILLNGLSVYLSSLEFWNKGYGTTIISNTNHPTKDCGGEASAADVVGAIVGGIFGTPVGAFFGAVISSAFDAITNEDCW